MPISPQQKAWLERFCKVNRYQLASSAKGTTCYKKPIGPNMIASIAYGEGTLCARFLLVASKIPYQGGQQIPWLVIGPGVNDLKLQLMASMSAAWDEVFNKVTGCGLDELKNID